MAYCTVPEVREMLKPEVLSDLIGTEMIDDPRKQERMIKPLIQEAIGDADGEIDGYLGGRYRVPLPRVPKMINKCSKDIAVYNLFSRQGIDEQSEAKNYLNRYRAAIDYLKLVAEGKIDLDTGDTDGGASTGFTVRSNNRLFTRDSMKGF